MACQAHVLKIDAIMGNLIMAPAQACLDIIYQEVALSVGVA